MSSNKSRALFFLKKKKKLIFNIPDFLTINIFDWEKNKEKFLKEIKKKFKNDILIIRSSASDEDKKKNTNAGKYTSVENIKASNNKSLIFAINKVKESIKSERNLNNSDEIIVQKMIKNVLLSGVIFTKLIENGSNYYSINYDDISGKTNLVTSGKSKNSNKMLYIRRERLKYLRSKRFIKLIEAVQDLEKKLNSENLDIEFAMDKNFKTFLFQVRPLFFKKKNLKEEVNLELSKVSKKIDSKLKSSNSKFGNQGILGNMPDWNPAEIIGQYPTNLSRSLFANLITNDIWALAREEIGYQKILKKKLVDYFAGQPYVDVRLSFNSFIFKEVPSKIKNQLVNHWLETLKNNTEYHDKVEFMICLTCYTFDDSLFLKKKLPQNIKKKEKDLLINILKKKTINFIKDKKIIDRQITRIFKLEEYIEKKYKNLNLISEIKDRIHLCRKYGTLPFSILARFAFISQAILDSLIRKQIISAEEKNFFARSVKTVTTSFINDLKLYKRKKIEKKLFYKKYGHLRPGTYDILSKNYKEAKFLSHIDSRKISPTKVKHFKLSKNSYLKFKKLLAKEKINLDPEAFFDFFYKSIKFREEAKFIYSKQINKILILLKKLSKKFKISKNEIAFVDLKSIYQIDKNFARNKIKNYKLRNLARKNQSLFELNKRIKLPQLIFDKTAPYVIPHITNSANFITSKKITSKTIEINPGTINKNISKKIVLIASADPGYDWIFDKSIFGLITKFGGANSHMAIRCSELNLPAAIGVGEKKYLELVKSKDIELNCNLKKIDIIKW